MDLNFVFDYQMLKLGISLLGLIMINIMLGSMDGFLKREFDKEKLINGAIKGVVVTIGFIGVYLIGNLVPDIAIEIGGQQLTLLMGVSIILLSGFGFYGYEVLKKLASFVKAKFDTDTSIEK